MKKLITLILLFLFSSTVNALSLNDIKTQLEATSTYQMYQNMGSTSISTTKNTLLINYPSLNPDSKQTKIVKYILKDDILMTSFTGDIKNRFDVLDNNDPWTFEIIDIIALSNGNSSTEIKSITKSYLKDTKFSDDKIEVSYTDYDVINLNGEEEEGSLIKTFQISLDYKINKEDLDKEISTIELLKLSKKKVTLRLSSTLDNATCTLYYKDNSDDILYSKISEVNCGKKDKDTKITIDIKDSTKTYYFISYINNHPLESNILEVYPKSQTSIIPVIIIILALLGVLILKKSYKILKAKKRVK